MVVVLVFAMTRPCPCPCPRHQCPPFFQAETKSAAFQSQLLSIRRALDPNQTCGVLNLTEATTLIYFRLELELVERNVELQKVSWSEYMSPGCLTGVASPVKARAGSNQPWSLPTPQPPPPPPPPFRAPPLLPRPAASPSQHLPQLPICLILHKGKYYPRTRFHLILPVRS